MKAAVIGRVAVKVAPDTSSFKTETKKALDRIEKSLRVKIPTTVDMTGARRDALTGVRELNATLKRHAVRIRTEVDRAAMKQTASEIERLRERISPVEVKVKVNTNPLRKLLSFMANIGASAAKFAAAAAAIGGIAAASLSAASNMAALAVSLASIAPAALALPGLLTGIGLGLAAIFLALKDFNKVLPDVKGKLEDLQNAISARFWEQAQAPIREFVDVLLPQFAAGMTGISTSLGRLFGDLATSLKTSLDGAIGPMFARLSESIEIARGGTDALAGVIKNLGLIGADYLPRLSQWFVDITERFNNFLSTAAADGRLKQWIDTALIALQDLGRALGGAFEILAGIGRAAAEAGGSSLAIFANALQRIADVVNGPAFQTMLTGVFRAAHQAMDSIATIAGPALTGFFLALGDVLTKILPIIGEALGTALAAVATALSDIRVQDAIVGLFEALGDAVKELAPYVPEIVRAFADLVKTVVPLIPVLVEIAKYVLPDVIRIIDEVGYVIGGLQRTFKNLVRDAKETWRKLQEGWQSFRDFFTVDWSKTWGDVKRVISEKLQQVKNSVSTFFRETGTQASEKLAALRESFSQKWSEIKTGVSEKVGEIKRSLSDGWTSIKDTASRALGDLVRTIGTKVGEGARSIGELPGKAVAALASFGRELAGKATSAFGEMKTAISTGVGDAARTVGELPGKAVSALGNIGGTLAAAGRSLIDGFIGGIRDKFRAVRETLSSLTSMLPDWKGPAKTDRVILRDAGRLVIDGLVNGMESQYGAVQKTLAGLTRTIGSTTIEAPQLVGPHGGMSAQVQRAMASAEFEGPTVTVNKNLYYTVNGGTGMAEEDLWAASSRARMVGW
jgi:phage-related protein